jgi:hypothetical protein
LVENQKSKIIALESEVKKLNSESLTLFMELRELKKNGSMKDDEITGLRRSNDSLQSLIRMISVPKDDGGKKQGGSGNAEQERLQQMQMEREKQEYLKKLEEERQKKEVKP